MGIIAFIILIATARWMIVAAINIIKLIIVALFTPSRSSRKRTVTARSRSERIKSPEQIEMERIKLEREKLRLEYDKQRIETMKENARYTRWKRKEQYRADRNGCSRSEQQKRLAQIDLDYCDQSLSDLTCLVDHYREQYENTITDKTKEHAYKKLSQLEKQQNALDKKRQAALFILNGV